MQRLADNWIQSLDAEVCTPGILQESSEGYAWGKADSRLLLGDIYHHFLHQYYFHISGMPSNQPPLDSNSRFR
jgi:hypothetical protein